MTRGHFLFLLGAILALTVFVGWSYTKINENSRAIDSIIKPYSIEAPAK
jgi:CHASE3 domain sensor protein